MHILIPNVTGPTNIGDQAILLPAIELLKNNFPGAYITIHTTSPSMYKKDVVDKVDSHLYNWAVFEDKSSLKRIKRLTELLIAYSSLKLNLPLFAKGKLKYLLEDYFKADIILFIGGGYFRSKRRFSQTLNLIMISSLFRFARLTKAVKVVMPFSYGPFAYAWQERYSADTLDNFDLIAARELFSFNALKKSKVKNVILAADTALLLDAEHKTKKTNDFILGFTIRNWFTTKRQNVFDKDFIEAICAFTHNTHSSIQPIIQVKGNNYGESDEVITKKIVKALKKRNVTVLPVQIIRSTQDLFIYSQIDLLLGMRMHSNILAAVYGTPFVALSYEHKTEGIAKNLDMQDFVIKCEEVNKHNLYELLMKAYESRISLKKTIDTSIKKIKKTETDRWNNYFQAI